MKMFEELIKVNKENNTVSARELHEFLESKERFSKWFNRMLEYGFQPQVDFNSYKKVQVQLEGNREIRREFSDYIITIDMAKELSMIQRTEKGKQARQYFIQCEKFIEESKLTEEFKYYRETGKVARRDLTNTVKEVIKPSNNFVYRNYTELAYKLAFNKDTKQLKAELNLGKKDNLRDNLSSDMLKEILLAEEKIKGMITTFEIMGIEEKEIYHKIKEIILK